MESKEKAASVLTASSSSSSSTDGDLTHASAAAAAAAVTDGGPLGMTKSQQSRRDKEPTDHGLMLVNSYATSAHAAVAAVARDDDEETSSAAGGSAAAAGGDLEKRPTRDSMHPDAFPDGGWQAWSVVAGGFCALFVSFGWINAIGVFQQVYQTDILRDYSPSTISWIVSLESFLMFFGGPIVGVTFDNYGPRPLLVGGTVLHVAGLLGASFGSTLWHFILCQGIISPLGASAVFYPAMSSVVTWFHARRGLALGLMASGSSLGGVIFPIMVTKLLPKIGFGWTMRACDLVILGLLIITNLTVRPRTPPRPRAFHLKQFAQPLTELRFLALTVAATVIFFGFMIPFAYLPVQSVTVGVTPTLSGYVIPILNAVSIVGRITPGYISDHVGRFNTTVAMTALCGVLTLALWLPARSMPAVIVYAVGYGFGSGAFVAIMPALVAAVSSDLRTIGTRNGTLFAFVSIGALLGNPIAGALIGTAGRYDRLILFSGCFVTGGTLLMALTRTLVAGGRLVAKV